MILGIFLLFLALACAKVYDRCELARELKYIHNAPSHQLATWVCIAEHESQYNTSIVGHLNGDGSGDHGIFQISDQYWCSPPGKGHACGLTCAELEDDDITDDFNCAQIIYKEHKTLSGDGFNAWAVYQPLCKGSKANRYIKDCFNESKEPKILTNSGSIFAHGFFDTVAGRVNKEQLIEKSIFEPALSLKSNFESEFSGSQNSESGFQSDFVNFENAIPESQSGVIDFQNPTSNLQNELPSVTKNVNFVPSRSPFFVNNIFIPTSKTNADALFRSITTTTYKPFTSTTKSLARTTMQPISSLFQPTIRPFTTLSSTIKTPSLFNFKTFSSPSIFSPSTTTTSNPSRSVTYAEPIFIINGVKWI